MPVNVYQEERAFYYFFMAKETYEEGMEDDSWLLLFMWAAIDDVNPVLWAMP